MNFEQGHSTSEQSDGHLEIVQIRGGGPITGGDGGYS